MTEEQARAKLHEAAQFRVPKHDPDASMSAHASALENALLETAVLRGDLEEARIYIHEARATLREQWDEMQGWEGTLPPKSRRTQADITEAKRKARPDLHKGIRDGTDLISMLTDQIKRLVQDDAAISRAYTIATGSG